MKAFRFSIFAALVVLLASCQEEIWPDGLVKEGVPTTIDFSISVPAESIQDGAGSEHTAIKMKICLQQTRLQ